MKEIKLKQQRKIIVQFESMKEVINFYKEGNEIYHNHFDLSTLNNFKNFIIDLGVENFWLPGNPKENKKIWANQVYLDIKSLTRDKLIHIITNLDPSPFSFRELKDDGFLVLDWWDF